jgi:hypothetical protein
MFPTHARTFSRRLTSGPLWVCKTCGQAAQSIPAAPALWTTHLAPLQCQATRQHSVTLLTECSVAGDKTRRAHAVEDIIGYSKLVDPYGIGVHPVATCRALGHNVTAVTLCYKRSF